jgi:hypothetical protein
MTKPLVSAVLVSYNMARELPRTVRSLSPAMQHGIRPGDSEIIVVDNGSKDRTDWRSLRQWGGQVTVASKIKPTHSPVLAANLGIDMAEGGLIGLMIDGARMASPGLLLRAVQASRIHPRAVIATVGFHLGSEHQSVSVRKGYCQSIEDELLARSDWTVDGYRLFDISVFAGSSPRGWFYPMLESNALFMSQALWGELGGLDSRFVTSGGGLANLDLFVRACELPDVQLVVILGEGTFHQVHGGVSANAPVSRWNEFHSEYVSIRGKPFSGPKLPALVFGSVTPKVATSIAWSAQQLLV